MEITYSNHYGELVLEPISDYKTIKEFGYLRDNVAEENTFSIDCAEKIALISNNENLQLCASPNNIKVWSVVHHKLANFGCWCKIKKLEFNSNVNPTKEIINSRQSWL